MTRIFRGGRLAALLLLTGILTPAFAANIGVIDFQVIMAKYEGAKHANIVLGQYYEKVSAPVIVAQTGLGLSKDDLALYKTLTAKTAREEEAIKALEAKSQGNRKTFDSLRGKVKAALSAEEQREFDQLYQQIINASSQITIGQDVEQSIKKMEQRYQELEKKGITALQGDEVKTYETLHLLIKANIIELNKLDDILQAQMEKEQQRYQKIFSDELEKAIAKVAKEQKLTMVISKSMQTGAGTMEKLVLWTDGNADISDKVVKALNDNFKLELLR